MEWTNFIDPAQRQGDISRLEGSLLGSWQIRHKLREMVEEEGDKLITEVDGEMLITEEEGDMLITNGEMNCTKAFEVEEEETFC